MPNPTLATLLVLFIGVPLVEVALLLRLAAWTSGAFTLGLVVVTAVLGGLLAKHQGLAVYRRLEEDLLSARLPTQALVEGLLVLAGGLLLLMPGMITDVVGLVCLVPLTRAAIVRRLREYFRTIVVASEGRHDGKNGPDDCLPG